MYYMINNLNIDFKKKNSDSFLFLTPCLLGNFSCCRLFSKLTFSKNSFTNSIRVSNGLDPYQDRCSVGPDLVPNCLQRLPADDTCRQRVNSFLNWYSNLMVISSYMNDANY